MEYATLLLVENIAEQITRLRSDKFAHCNIFFIKGRYISLMSLENN